MSNKIYKVISFQERLRDHFHIPVITPVLNERRSLVRTQVVDETTSRIVSKTSYMPVVKGRLNKYKVSDFCTENLLALDAIGSSISMSATSLNVVDSVESQLSNLKTDNE